MIVEHLTLRVFTGEEWLANQMNGYEKGRSKIEIIRDPYNRPIIGTTILNDPTWNMQAPFTSPDNITKPLIEWLTEIPYCYIEETEHI